MSENTPAEKPTTPSMNPVDTPTRKPVMPSVAIIAGLKVGVGGLVMTILGIGWVSLTHLSVSHTVDVQTTSGGVLAMVIGFGMSTFVLYLIIDVDRRRAKRSREGAGGRGYDGANRAIHCGRRRTLLGKNA